MTRSRGFWNFMAARYARQSIADPDAYARKLAQTQALMRPDMEVLEFGCGTGSTALTHAPHVARITGLDYSPKMIAIARSKIADVPNVGFEVSTLADWAAGDASYDMVLGLNILHLLPDHRAALAKIARLLKPGGYLVTSTACLGDRAGMLKRILPVASALRLLPFVAQFSRTELESDLTDAGFTIQQSWQPGPGQGYFHICRTGDQA